MSFGSPCSPAILRLAMTPINFPIIGSTACNLAGTLYPIYSTYRALEKREEGSASEQENDRQEEDSEDELRMWLCYWTVFGGLKLVDGLTDPLCFWMPYYYPIKLGLLLWLQLPQFKGAHYVYTKHLKPLLVKYQPKIEIILAFLKDKEWIIESQRPYLQMFANIIQLAHRNAVEFLMWFFSQGGDKGQKTLPRCQRGGDDMHQLPHDYLTTAEIGDCHSKGTSKE